MHLLSSKYGPKLGHPKIAHHSNLSPSLDSKVENWSRTAKTIVWTALNQFVVFQSQLGPSLSNEQILDHLILTETR